MRFNSDPAMNSIVKVAVDGPFNEPLDYLLPQTMEAQTGLRCVVPLGKRRVIGIITALTHESSYPREKLKPVERILDEVAPLSDKWLQLANFASDYYFGAPGRMMVPSLPKFFRSLPGANYERSLERARKRSLSSKTSPDLKANKAKMSKGALKPELNPEQKSVVQGMAEKSGFYPALLFGVTGSGKTEVYLHVIEEILQKDGTGQILLLVPEINLTPQLVARVQARFPGHSVVSWNSSMAEGEKASAWLAAHEGRARILVGTRLSVFASFPNLKLIIVDEEHDSSFKSQEGIRYNARDLAIKRAQIEDIPVLLGSATPSLETYHNAREGRYRLFRLSQRAVHKATLPELFLVDMRKERIKDGLCPTTAQAINETLGNKKQCIVFLNRRGYSPIVECNACGWKAECPHCSAFTVFHKTTGNLICHHCGYSTPLPKSCPSCGSFELEGLGRGTQRSEHELEARWPQARILRLDQDSTRKKGGIESSLEAVHNGEVDILVGTQMIAKGHDFKNVALVAVLNSDGQLRSPDFRAREKLFSVLTQVAGRAGRGEARGRVLIQTRYSEDPLFMFLEKQDYEGFALYELEGRKMAHLSPFGAQALIVSEGKTIEEVLQFLKKMKEVIASMAVVQIKVYDPVPLAVQKVKDIERAQLLIEAPSKKQMQRFLALFRSELEHYKIRRPFYVDVDPMNI